MKKSADQLLKLFIIPLLLFPASCNEAGESADVENKLALDNSITHAQGFEIEVAEEYRILRVYDPWQGASNLTFEYILVDRDTDLPDPLPRGILVRTPVESVICLSTTHIAMLDFIGAVDNIKAVSGSQYIYNSQIRQKISENLLPDIGYEMNLDYELILQLDPELIFAYGVGAEAASYVSRLQNLGINVVLIGEYLEQTPLGQAEWVKFISHFFNSQDYATEKFLNIEEQYNNLTELTGNLAVRPRVLTGLPWRDSWFVPGGGSLLASLISDAGGEYLFRNNQGRENFPVNLETVFSRAVEAEYWINTGTALSMKDIVNTDSRLAGLHPFRNGSVFNNNARIGEAGGNDFWESGIVNPHIVLRDLINILHPGLLEADHLTYYRKL